jgi:hypothetical protein
MAALGLIVVASLARASDSEEIARDKLPQAVSDHIKHAYIGAELLRAWKEMEGDKQCFVVEVVYQDHKFELYASSDGRILALKREVVLSSGLWAFLHDSVLFLLVPGVIAGALARWLAQALTSNKLPVLLEGLSAWIGALIICAVILATVTTVPRHKDPVVISATSLVWSAIAASLVEILGLTAQSFRRYRVVRRSWIIGFCLSTLVFLCLSIPVHMLRADRENQYFRALVMSRPVSK